MTKVHLLAPPPAQVAAGALVPISLNDLSTAFHNEPRVHDLFLAERLGFKALRDIRQLISRNADEMKTYGAVIHQRALNAGPRTSPQGAEKSSGRMGRPTKEFWLNEGQALLICALARTTAAARIRRELITVFMAYRTGELTPAIHVAPQMADLMALTVMVEKVKADVAILRRQMGGLFGRIDEQNKALEVASKKAAVKLISSRVVAGPINPPAALLYGVKAISTYINVTPRQAQWLIETGRLKAHRMGRRHVCTTQALDAWMASMAADKGRAS